MFLGYGFRCGLGDAHGLSRSSLFFAAAALSAALLDWFRGTLGFNRSSLFLAAAAAALGAALLYWLRDGLGFSGSSFFATAATAFTFLWLGGWWLYGLFFYDRGRSNSFGGRRHDNRLFFTAAATAAFLLRFYGGRCRGSSFNWGRYRLSGFVLASLAAAAATALAVALTLYGTLGLLLDGRRLRGSCHNSRRPGFVAVGFLDGMAPFRGRGLVFLTSFFAGMFAT
jgi:hypothetical protein